MYKLISLLNKAPETMNKIFVLINFTFLIHTIGAAQEEFNGLLLEDETYEELRLTIDPPERGNLPLLVDLKPFCPVPGDQGQQPSCVAWTIANALTVMRSVKENETSAQRKQDLRLSVSYIYNQIKYQGDCQKGATFSAGLNLLRSRGDCLAKSLSYDATQCHQLPSNIHHQQAAKYRIASFYKLFSKHSTSQLKINSVLSAIANKQPVILGLKVPFGLRKRVPKSAEGWKAETHHAMLAVGYNDLTETITLMNSYGENWGDSGYCEIDFQSLGENVVYAYVIELGKDFGHPMAR